MISILDLMKQEKIIPQMVNDKTKFTLSRKEENFVKNLGFDDELLSLGEPIVRELMNKHYFIMQKVYHPDRNIGVDERITSILSDSKDYIEDKFIKLVRRNEKGLHNPPLRQFIEQKNEEYLLKEIISEIYSNEDEISSKRLKLPIIREGVEMILSPLRDIGASLSAKRCGKRIKKSDFCEDEKESSYFFAIDKNGKEVSIVKDIIHEGEFVLKLNKDGTLQRSVAKFSNDGKNSVFLGYENDKSFPETTIFATIKNRDLKNVKERLKENAVKIGSLYGGLDREDLKYILKFISPYLSSGDFLVVRQKIRGKEFFKVIGKLDKLQVQDNHSKKKIVLFHKNYEIEEFEMLKTVYPDMSKNDYQEMKCKHALMKNGGNYSEETVNPIIKEYKNPLQKLGIGKYVACMPFSIFKCIVRAHYFTIKKMLIEREMRFFPQIFSKDGRILSNEELPTINKVARNRRDNLLRSLKYYSDAYNEINPDDKSKNNLLIHCQKSLANEEYRRNFLKNISGSVFKLIAENERLRNKIIDSLIPQEHHITDLFEKKISYYPIVSFIGKVGVLKQKNTLNIKKMGKISSLKTSKKAMEGDKSIIGGISFSKILEAGGIQEFFEQNGVLSLRDGALAIEGNVDQKAKVKNYEGIYVPYHEDFSRLLSSSINDKDLIVSFINNNGQKYYKIEGVANL